jgi:hypothetical protein
MNTIFIPVYPKPSGANITELCVDFNAFDPHEGVRFSVVMKNPAGIVIDKTYTNLAGDDWQDWPPEQTAEADYDYVKNVVLSNLGYTQAFAPFFITQPQDANVNSGQAASFSCLVSGDLPISYQWRKNGSLISGAINNIYDIASASETDIGSYSVIATNAAASVDSAFVHLSINEAPSIQTQPISVTGDSGSSCQFYVVAQGTSPLVYQWEKDGVAISGANTNTYQVQQIKDSDAGNYLATITNVAGSIQTDIATLTVITPPPPPEIPPIAPEPTGNMP